MHSWCICTEICSIKGRQQKWLSLSTGYENGVNFPTVNPKTTHTRQKLTSEGMVEIFATYQLKLIRNVQFYGTQAVVEIGNAKMTSGKLGRYSRPARASFQELVVAHDRHLTARPHLEAGPTEAVLKPKNTLVLPSRRVSGLDFPIAAYTHLAVRSIGLIL